MRLERRLEQPWWLGLAIPVGSLAVAFGIMAIVLAATGHDPGHTYRTVVDAGFTGNGALSATFLSATPILFTGLAAAAAFRMQLFNIGAEGQLYLGAVGGSWIALQLGDRGAGSTFVYVVAMCAAAAALGAAWALIPGVLRAFAHTNEIITSLMLNYVAAYLITYVIFDSSSYWRDISTLQARSFPQGKPMPDASEWPTFGTSVVVPLGFLVGLAAAFVLWVLYSRTRFGFEVSVIADSPRAARDAAQGPRRDGPLGRARRARGRQPDRRFHAHARPDRTAGSGVRLHRDRRRGARSLQPLRGLRGRGANRRAAERRVHAPGRRLSLRSRRRHAGSHPVLRTWGRGSESISLAHRAAHENPGGNGPGAGDMNARLRLAFAGETMFPHAFPRPGFARANSGLAQTQRGPLLLENVGNLPVPHTPSLAHWPSGVGQ
ncbi:MAG: ABC transporter permease [Actinobacteria bacterium]|nr:MAG: ABC transporter permease [Actinomycetota bacterium]